MVKYSPTTRDDYEKRELLHMPGYARIRELPTQDLRDIGFHVRALLSYADAISVELHIKLSTLNANVIAALEDREDTEESGKGHD